MTTKEMWSVNELCNGCHWKEVGRYVKCVSCIRNPNAPDNYLTEEQRQKQLEDLRKEIEERFERKRKILGENK